MGAANMMGIQIDTYRKLAYSLYSGRSVSCSVKFEGNDKWNRDMVVMQTPQGGTPSRKRHKKQDI